MVQFSNDTVFTHDKAVASFKETDGVTVDSDTEEVTVNWEEVERVQFDSVPLAEHFDTKEFYKLSATVAKPIKQPYQFGEDRVTLMKPREELKKAAWSLDNRPFTLGHPSTGMVKDVNDVHGFWKNPRYIDSLDDLDADLFIPVNDEEATSFIEDNRDVSVGFYNRIISTDAYDGQVGSSDDLDGVDGFQTNMHFDHVAGVRMGRCSSEQGCGLDTTSLGTVISDPFIKDTRTIKKSDEAEIDILDASKFVNSEDGNWYAVPPSDNPDDEWKFPIQDCNDAKDAWNLRGSGDISISVDTLEERIKRRANELGCELPDTANDSTKNMTEGTTDCGCDGGKGQGIDIDIDALSVDAVAAKHDGVKELIDEKAELEKELESTEDEVALKDEKIEELSAKVDEYESEAKQELIDDIADRTERWSADELAEMSLEDVQDKHALVMELSTDEKVANGGSEKETAPSQTAPERQTPWE